jgi:hypothetical protein
MCKSLKGRTTSKGGHPLRDALSIGRRAMGLKQEIHEPSIRCGMNYIASCATGRNVPVR